MHRKMRYMTLFLLPAALLIASCAGQSQKRSHLLDSEFNSEEFVTRIHDDRTWYSPAELPFNPKGLGKQVDIPVNDARTNKRISGKIGLILSWVNNFP